ncbi:MAG: O-antigen ligase family protein [Bacteroidota bacterium]
MLQSLNMLEVKTPDARWHRLGFRGYALLFALLPWSVEIQMKGVALELPGEPLQVVLGLWLLFLLLRFRAWAWASVRENRFIQLGLVWIAWSIFTSFYSTMPLVSWKYTLVETAHWGIFALGMSLFPHWWRRLALVFTVSMSGFVIYTLFHHAGYHFRVDQAILAPMPFFPEHTAYAAVVALVLPWLVLGVFNNIPKRLRFSMLGLALTGLLFAFSRAAWLSVAGAGALGLIWYFRAYGRLFFAFSTVLLGLLWLNSAALSHFYAKKLSDDVSSQERINRYACAARMYVERPWLGFGPGTFQFQYLPYQQPTEMTRISVQAPISGRNPDTYGRGGGAHSEYWQALTESGLPGLLLFLGLFWGLFGIGLLRLFRVKQDETTLVLLACLLSILTFLLHGFVNNLLHDTRVAALVWGQLGFISTILSRIYPRLPHPFYKSHNF